MGETMIEYLLLTVGITLFAFRAIRTERILFSTFYLACVSAITAILLYHLGAHQVAVIELSVGAGLVTVLLLYAISVVGTDATDVGQAIPWPVAAGVGALTAVLLGWMVVTMPTKPILAMVPPLAGALWSQRVLDVWIQMVLIFAGVLGILGLLAEAHVAKQAAGARRAERTVQMTPLTACAATGARARTPDATRNEVHE